MTDEQRASLAKEHLEKAGELINKLVADGAAELEAAQENIVDLVSLLDDLDFEEGNLTGESEPVTVRAANQVEEEEEDEVEEFREDEEEE